MSICSRSTATPGRSDQLSALNITVRNTRCRDLLIPSVVTIVVPLRDEDFCRQPTGGKAILRGDGGKEDVVRENGVFGGSNVVIFLSRANTT